MTEQRGIYLRGYARGFHLITHEVLAALPPLPESGLFHLFIRHTSAGLTLNENADPGVLYDFETIFNRMVPEGKTLYRHNDEGPDDMPAHIKASLTGASLTIPISGGRLGLGTWQGIYLCEFRDHAPGRQLVATIVY